MAKSDRRVKYTKQVIRSSLYEMLRTIPIEQVTVKALCEKAEINRATFYSHYETLSALLAEIEEEESRELFAMMEAGAIDRRHVEQTIERVVWYLKTHPTMREVFLSKNSPLSGLTGMTGEYQRRIVTHIAQERKIPKQQAEWMLAFVVSGVREVLRQWFSGDMQQEDLLKQTLVNQILGGFKEVI